jgi:hypothetical protein
MARKSKARYGAALAVLWLGTAAANDGTSLVASETRMVSQSGGRNPTVAVDRRSGAVYLAWAQEPPVPADQTARHAERRLEVLVARSGDGGRSFSAPVVASAADDRVESQTVSPTQVAVGPTGIVYVLYSDHDPDFKPPGWDWGRNRLRLVRSEDGGERFSAPVEIGAEEGVETSVGMLNLFAAPGGDLYISFLDYREALSYLLEHGKDAPQGQEPPTQLRVSRSSDGGRRFVKSVLVAKPTCGCCGTRVAQGIEGPLYATTRGQWEETPGTLEAVRDLFVSTSRDTGQTWSEPVKIHDDRFKVSGCPDVSSGLAVDSKGRLHAAWYTGAEGHPGVYYARSDDEGKTFSTPIALLSDEWVPYGDVKLALDALDHAWVAFEDRRGEEDQIRVARIAPAGRPQLSEPWPGAAPDVVAQGESVIVAWGGKTSDGEAAGGQIGTRILGAGRLP